MNEFGKRLKKIREEKGLTHAGLGAAVGSTKSHMRKYENKDVDPGLKTMIRLANFLGVTLDWLAGNGDFDDVQFANKEKYGRIIYKIIQTCKCMAYFCAKCTLYNINFVDYFLKIFHIIA